MPAAAAFQANALPLDVVSPSITGASDWLAGEAVFVGSVAPFEVVVLEGVAPEVDLDPSEDVSSGQDSSSPSSDVGVVASNGTSMAFQVSPSQTSRTTSGFELSSRGCGMLGVMVVSTGYGMFNPCAPFGLF